MAGVLTKQDFDELERRFATKEDFKQCATKDDLKDIPTRRDPKGFTTKNDLTQFATKDDLKPFATKEDLKPFATKDDLKRFATKDEHNHAVAVLERKIDRSQEEVLGAINSAMQNLVHHAEFAQLQHRVSTLERKVS